MGQNIVKVIMPKKLNEIYFPNWRTFLEFDNEKRQISVVTISDADGYPESLRDGTKYWVRLLAKGRKLREVNALINEIAPIYEQALDHYTSIFNDEEFKRIGRFDTEGEVLMRKIDGIITYF